MKLMDDLIPMKLYSKNKRVMLPVNSKDKKHGSAIFLMGQTMAENQELLTMPYLYKGNKLFRSYFIDRNVVDYVDSNAINGEEIQESAITEGIIHTEKDIFTFKNAGTMDQQVLKAVFNKDTLKWCYKRLGMRESPVDSITVYLYASEDEFHKVFRTSKKAQFYSFTEGTNIHILQKLAYDEDGMDGPYDLYCLHELIYCLIINEYPNISLKIARCTAMALSGQVEWLRKKKEEPQFKFYHSEDEHIDGLYIADVIYELYKTKGGYGIKKFLEGDLSGFNTVASRRILAWFDTSFKESFAEGTLTAKEKAKLKDSDYGIPSKKKYPMPDKAHVKAAIRMFNHCSEEDEAELASAIKRKIKEYDITDVKISDKNRLSKYVSESMILQEYTILDHKEPEPSQMGFYSGEGEKKRWNSIVEINGKKYRERSEILLIKDGKIFISRQDDGTYKIPGGGTEPNKSCEEQCSRECQEEAFITPKNLRYVLTYRDKYPNPSPNNDYVGHITYLYIGEYDRKFTGNVAPTDRDSRISKGDFFEIEEIYDELIEPHKQGLMRYFNIHEAVINLNELSTNSQIEVDFKKKHGLNLSSFKVRLIDDDICDKYNLSHVDTDEECTGEAYFDNNGELVAYLNTKKKDNGTVWIQALEVEKEYRGHGLSSQLIEKAKLKYHVTNLSVNKNNQVAYNLYKKNGFTEYQDTGKMIFMSTDSNYKEQASLTESETPDIPYLEYDTKGRAFAGNYSESYYNVLEILSTLSKKEFDIVSFYSTYKDSDSIKKRIILKDPNGVPMSFMDVYWFEDRPYEAQITTAVSGYYRGHHLCAMMFQQLLDSGFAEEYGIHTYIWNAHPDNEASKKIALSNKFVLRSEDLDKFGRQRYEYHTSLYKKFSDSDLRKLPESAMILDESTVFIFREADEVEGKYDKKIRRYLYKERLKNVREVLPLYEQIKANNPDIDRTYRELKLYKGQNVYVDVSYYHGLYLQNTNMNRSKQAIYMYLDFLARLMDTKNFKPMYQKFTYFVPVFKKLGVDVLDWKSDINILSIIIYLAKKDPNKLKRWGSGKRFVFLGNNGYLVIDFDIFNARNLPKLKSHLTKLIDNTPITDNDLEDDDFDEDNDSKGAAVEILGTLETNKGIKINDISKIGSSSQIGHLVMNTDLVAIDKKPESTAIMILTPSTSTFKSEIEDRNLKSKDITICYRPKLGL